MRGLPSTSCRYAHPLRGIYCLDLDDAVTTVCGQMVLDKAIDIGGRGAMLLRGFDWRPALCRKSTLEPFVERISPLYLSRN